MKTKLKKFLGKLGFMYCENCGNKLERYDEYNWVAYYGCRKCDRKLFREDRK